MRLFLFKKLQVFKKIKWGLWGHLGYNKTEAAEVKVRYWGKIPATLFILSLYFVLKRLLNCNREVWLLNLFGLHLCPQTPQINSDSLERTFLCLSVDFWLSYNPIPLAVSLLQTKFRKFKLQPSNVISKMKCIGQSTWKHQGKRWWEGSVREPVVHRTCL